MKSSKKLRILIWVFILATVLIVCYVFLKPHLNRLLDNRERAAMSRHGLLIQQRIQQSAHKLGHYPELSEVNKTIKELNFKSPHTNKAYELISNISNVREVKDSQIAYGLGELGKDNDDKQTAYFCIGINLPRTGEGGASCTGLTLDEVTDKEIDYGLSCKTNWLGFSTKCESKILLESRSNI